MRAEYEDSVRGSNSSDRKRDRRHAQLLGGKPDSMRSSVSD